MYYCPSAPPRLLQSRAVISVLLLLVYHSPPCHRGSNISCHIPPSHTALVDTSYLRALLYNFQHIVFVYEFGSTNICFPQLTTHIVPNIHACRYYNLRLLNIFQMKVATSIPTERCKDVDQKVLYRPRPCYKHLQRVESSLHLYQCPSFMPGRYISNGSMHKSCPLLRLRTIQSDTVRDHCERWHATPKALYSTFPWFRLRRTRISMIWSNRKSDELPGDSVWKKTTLYHRSGGRWAVS